MNLRIAQNRFLLLVIGAVAAFIISLTALPVAAQTDAKQQVCEGIGLTSGQAGCAAPAGSPTVNSAVQDAVDILSIVVGVIAVFMLIIAGLKYITAAGDAAKLSSAKDTIIYALVGLVVVLMAQVIVRYVVDKVA